MSTLSSNPTSPKSTRMTETEENECLQQVSSPLSSPNSLSITSEVEKLGIENSISRFDEKADASKYFSKIIKKTPPGQIENVSEYCKKLSYDDFGEKVKEDIELAVKKQKIQDGLLVKVKNEETSQEFFITSDNLNEDATILKIDNSNYRFISESFVELASSSLDQDQNEFEMELKNSLSKYVNDLYKSAGNISIQKNDKHFWKVHIIGKRSNCNSFWSGHWHSAWNIQLLDDDFIGLDGKISLSVHFHEEGSVQLTAEKVIQSLKLKIVKDDVAKSVEKIYWKVRDSEDAVQVALNEAYQHLSESSFKRLRRQMPISRTKMDWGKFSNYKIGDELKK